MTADPKPLSKRAQSRLLQVSAARAATVRRLAVSFVNTGDDKRWLRAAAEHPADVVEDAIWDAIGLNYKYVANAEDEIRRVHLHTEGLARERRAMIAAAKRDVP